MQKGVHRRQPSIRLGLRRSIFMPRCLPMLISSAYVALVLSACSFGADNNSRGNAPAPGGSTITRPSSISAAPTPMDTFRALAKPQGMRFTPLFSEPMTDADSRLKRLENAVQSLRNDFDTVVPSLVRLVAIEKDMRDMVSQMQSITGVPATSIEMPIEQVEIPSEDVIRGTEPVQSETGRTMAPTSLVTPEAAPKGMPPEGAASPNSAPQPSEIETVEVQKAAPAATTPVTPKAKAPAAAVAPPPAPAAPKAQASQPVAPPPAPAPTPAPTPTPVPVPAPAPQAATMPEEAAVQTAITTAKPAEAVAWNSVFGNEQPKVVDTPRPAPSAGSVAEVRIGDHADKTRIVLDATTSENITAAMANEGMQLVIDLPQMAWEGKPSWSADVAALVSGWTYRDGKLYVDLLYPATIKSQQALEGNASSMARIVIDLFSPDVHRQ